MDSDLARVSYEEFTSNLDSLFERVARERETIVIEKADGKRAILRPAPRLHHARRTKIVKGAEGFRAAFGGWKGIVDGETVKKDLAAERGSDRPPINL